jgi:hypothetical protein
MLSGRAIRIFSCFVLPQSVYRMVTDRMIGVRGFDSRRGLGIFLFSTASRTALGPTQPPIQWVPWAKRQGREADHSPPSSAKTKNEWRYTSSLHYVFMTWFLVKHSSKLSFTFTWHIHGIHHKTSVGKSTSVNSGNLESHGIRPR